MTEMIEGCWRMQLRQSAMKMLATSTASNVARSLRRAAHRPAAMIAAPLAQGSWGIYRFVRRSAG